MSFSTALEQLISIVKASTPTTKARGYPDKFKHAPASEEESLPQARGFWFTALSGHIIGPMHPTFPQRIRSEMVLNVRYSDDIEAEELSKILIADYLLLAGRLSSTANWGRPTSTIDNVNIGDAEQMPYTIDSVDGAKILRIRFPMDYRNPTSGGGF